MKQKPNIAFIDAQNLYMGTQLDNWKLDYKKFRTYLREKYHVTEAYYHLGFTDEQQQDLYTSLQQAGFIVTFREHHSALTGKKKGNVDTDIVFTAMKYLQERTDFNKIILVSGDGDYKKLVDYLIVKNKLAKLLFPNMQFASSLYKKLEPTFYDHLGKKSIKNKIEEKHTSPST